MMKKSTKAWIITAVLLVTVGLVTFAAVMFVYHWDFTKLNTVEYVTTEQVMEERVRNVIINTGTSDVRIAHSDDDKCRLVFNERKDNQHTVTMNGITLVIETTEAEKWYDNIGIDFGKPEITVYLPEEQYGRLQVKATTGDLTVPKGFRFDHTVVSLSTGDVNFSADYTWEFTVTTTTGDVNVNCPSAGEVYVSSSTGDVTISDMKCAGVVTEGGTGDAVLTNVRATQHMEAQRSTGNIVLESCDAPGVNARTSTGDVTGHLLSDKDFEVETTTGSVKVPDADSAHKCVIITTTGDVSFR